MTCVRKIIILKAQLSEPMTEVQAHSVQLTQREPVGYQGLG